MVFWEDYGISDEMMGTFAPIAMYWIYGGIYHMLPSLDHYRMHSRKEEEQKNQVPMATVIKGVLLQQFCQAVVALTMFSVRASSLSPLCSVSRMNMPLMWNRKFTAFSLASPRIFADA